MNVRLSMYGRTKEEVIKLALGIPESFTKEDAFEIQIGCSYQGKEMRKF